ncbi:hypothetical protein JQC91_14775 [Jannaschia sp. Os4]|uniref:hypothetical protein n=1 Tax=Jannaschia sp. Os4 TaxID=2807617 RepID=UPI00193A1583|nr:hypothetical protein [Jannaschia sp. Os4]MBM2577568.1 hypothetical protein [Jannaschia sp. Os4]
MIPALRRLAARALPAALGGAGRVPGHAPDEVPVPPNAPLLFLAPAARATVVVPCTPLSGRAWAVVPIHGPVPDGAHLRVELRGPDEAGGRILRVPAARHAHRVAELPHAVEVAAVRGGPDGTWRIEVPIEIGLHDATVAVSWEPSATDPGQGSLVGLCHVRVVQPDGQTTPAAATLLEVAPDAPARGVLLLRDRTREAGFGRIHLPVCHGTAGCVLVLRRGPDDPPPEPDEPFAPAWGGSPYSIHKARRPGRPERKVMPLSGLDRLSAVGFDLAFLGTTGRGFVDLGSVRFSRAGIPPGEAEMRDYLERLAVEAFYEEADASGADALVRLTY